MNNWYPERFFYSHSSKDDYLTHLVEGAIKTINNGYEIYIAERNLVGIPLIQKLREELIDCNALLLGWTKNTNAKSTSQIVSFELGMAYSLGLPIYIVKTYQGKMPWFFDKITDYIRIEDLTEALIKDTLEKIEPFTFFHPIDLLIPKEEWYKYPDRNQSKNIEFVQDDGTLRIPENFNDIIHFELINRRPKSEKNIRLLLKFPKEITLTFDAGSLDRSSKVQRNEIFDMRETPKGTVRMYWASLPVERVKFEIRLITKSNLPKTQTYIECLCSSDNVIGWKEKQFPLQFI
jgi:hypothetical protein